MIFGKPIQCSKCGWYNPPGKDCLKCSGGLNFEIRKTMKIDELLKQMKDGKVEFVGKCVDCETDVTIHAHIAGESLIIDGGAIFAPPSAWNHAEMYMFKCPACFEKDSKFYPATEVYSRCVGYMRPVSQWNDGKKAEFEQRKVFNVCEKC